MARVAPSPRPAAAPAQPGVPLAAFTFEELVERIRAEFIEQPGLRLTEAQASRLWQLTPATCHEALSMLIASGFLARTPDGRFARSNGL